IVRKLREAFLAIQLERRFTKDEILTFYLNSAYFGGGAYGVSAAADRYFAKSASMLSVGEAALLAGLLQAPSRLSPFNNPDAAEARMQLVLDAMKHNRALTSEAIEEVETTPVYLRNDPLFRAPYFLDAAQKEAEALRKAIFPVPPRLVFSTTLSSQFQSALEASISTHLVDLPPSAEIAAVLLDRDGAVRALVGGLDFQNSQFNRVVDARRQPGSAFKPFIYLAALEEGYSLQDLVLDEPIQIGNWRPDNYKSNYYGEVSLEFALAKSANAAAIRLQETTGRKRVRESARRMGIDSKLSAGPAMALGVDTVTPLELARAYAPFANGGFRITPYFIERVDDGLGGVLRQREKSYFDLAGEPDAINGMRRMLRTVVLEGTGRAAQIEGAFVAGKTGTTQSNRDAWFVGFADGLTLAIWIGRDDNQPMEDITGGGLPAKIWRDAMAPIVGDDPFRGRSDGSTVEWSPSTTQAADRYDPDTSVPSLSAVMPAPTDDQLADKASISDLLEELEN
ncbi:MAG: penicillin-binding transpeptidase domain-containing protein, partial [Pseudomonadota bacterium]